MTTGRRKLFVAAQWIFAAAIVWAAGNALRGQWRAAADRLATLSVEWTWIAAATAIVLLTYVLLIDTWRALLAGWGGYLHFNTAARIWFISNLGKYLPGKVWSIAAMSVMAREQAVSPVAAAGSSILIQLITIATGIALALFMGVRAIDQPVLATVVAIILGAAIASLPVTLPALARVASALTGRAIEVPPLGVSTLFLTVARSLLSWLAYGVAFQLFVRGVLGSAAGETSSYIAVYAASYILGFLALFAPGGVIVRESALVAGMVRMGLANQADAFAVAVASRLWLTVVELLPGFVYMALTRRSSSR